MRIWKWKLAMVDEQTIDVPEGARLLTVQIQDGAPQIWALHDERSPKCQRRIAIYGTGNPIPDDPGDYIATFQMSKGALVFHAFERQVSANARNQRRA